MRIGLCPRFPTPQPDLRAIRRGGGQERQGAIALICGGVAATGKGFTAAIIQGLSDPRGMTNAS